MAYGTINVPGMSGSDLEAVRKLLEEASPFLIQEEERWQEGYRLQSRKGV